MYDFENELSKIGLTPETYENVCKDIDAKCNGENDLDWSEIKLKYNIPLSSDVIRKANGTVFGGAFRTAYQASKDQKITSTEESQTADIDKKIEELRKERIKLQTANLERTRTDRSLSRQELFFEYVGGVIEALPVPDFDPIYNAKKPDTSYVVTISDLHYGATFDALNNRYSPEIAVERMRSLTGQLIVFAQDKQPEKFTVVMLGDTIQGLLRLSDLKINDSSIVKACVEVSRLIAQMLNTLSAYVEVDYYHVPAANHTQIRALGAKAGELGDEDLEYLIGNYIHDLCAANERINVILAAEGQDFLEIHLPGNELLAMHGHQLGNVENSLRDMCMMHQCFYTALLLGHFHNGKVIPVNENLMADSEILISPSFVGSDPYSDKLGKGAHAAVNVYGFDKLRGHIETYKLFLN